MVVLQAAHQSGVRLVRQSIGAFTGELPGIQIAVPEIQVSSIHFLHQPVVLQENIIHAANVQIFRRGVWRLISQNLDWAEWNQLENETQDGGKGPGRR
jgi:hypothetical protein